PGKCVITWQDALEFGDTELFSMQCQLYASGAIVFWYSGNTDMRTSGDCLIGMSPGGGAPIPPVFDLSAGGASAASTIWQTFNVSGGPMQWDLAGLSVRFVPAGLGYAVSTGPCASNQSYGSGCYPTAGSFYELFPASSFDLSGQTL